MLKECGSIIWFIVSSIATFIVMSILIIISLCIYCKLSRDSKKYEKYIVSVPTHISNLESTFKISWNATIHKINDVSELRNIMFINSESRNNTTHAMTHTLCESTITLGVQTNVWQGKVKFAVNNAVQKQYNDGVIVEPIYYTETYLDDGLAFSIIVGYFKLEKGNITFYMPKKACGEKITIVKNNDGQWTIVVIV